MRRLEDELGVNLLHRGSRSVVLSDDGRALQQRTAPLLSSINEAMLELSERNRSVSGCLRITTTPAFGQSLSVVNCLKTFGLKYPNISLEVVLAQRVVDLVEEGFDIALRLHQNNLPGRTNIRAKHLFDFTWGFYASPSILEATNPIAELADISSQHFALHSSIDLRRAQWKRNGTVLTDVPAMPVPKWKVDDSTVLERLAVSGAAIALLETFTATQRVATGQLVRVLPQYEWTAGQVSLVWPATHHLSSRVRAFIEHVGTDLSIPKDNVG